MLARTDLQQVYISVLLHIAVSESITATLSVQDDASLPVQMYYLLLWLQQLQLCPPSPSPLGRPSDQYTCTLCLSLTPTLDLDLIE